jgi:hypothetical protein
MKGLLIALSLIVNLQDPLTPRLPRLSDSGVAAIQNAAKGRTMFDFVGLTDFDHGTLKLHVTSNRAVIAFNTGRAAAANARYTPLPEERLDTVRVQCGDADLNELFLCARVRVIRPDKTEVQPLSYSALPAEHENTRGVVWTSHEVHAAYAVSQLTDGFTVVYTATDGAEWTFDVSAQDAGEKLLLKVAADIQQPVI